MSLMESFQRPTRSVPSDNRDHISSKAFVDWMPLDIDTLANASHLKNSRMFCNARKTCRQVELLTGHARDAPIQRNNGNGCGEGKEGLGRPRRGQGGHLEY